MNKESARILNRLTSEFYTRNATTFSATRTRAWDGWLRCADVLRELGMWNKLASVLDIGCGNLRFEAFLAEQRETLPEIWAIDNCTPLLPKDHGVHFRKLDIIETLIEGSTLAETLDAPPCELVCAFGVMHHIPGAANRTRFLDSLLEMTSPGGYALVSLWQFMKDERISKKALKTTDEALEANPNLELEKGDYLLGWQETRGSYRYCHNYGEREIQELIAHAEKQAELVTRFEADGKPGNLNAYLILKRNV